MAWLAALGVCLMAVRRAEPGRLRALLKFPRPDGVTLALLAASALVLVVTGVVAVVTPPNNWDVLDYHLPRQIYWMQQGGVGIFPSSDFRQIAFAPFAEYVGLHLMTLSAGDAYANMVQWGAFLLSAVAASLVARNLGGGRGQALAALLLVTIPAAAMEASNAKNDVVAGFFVLALAVFTTEVLRDRSCPPSLAVLIGASGRTRVHPSTRSTAS